ncbi:MAG: acyl carrier protein [Gemmatimonadales bacterium]
MDPSLRARIERRRVMLDRVRSMLIERLNLPLSHEEIDPDTPLFGSGLALDSIDAVELTIHLRTDFGIEIPTDQAGRAELRTVNSLVDLAIAVPEAPPNESA